MLFSFVTVLALGALSSALPVELEERAQCNADYVLRLLRATQVPNRLDEALPWCSDKLGLPKVTETASAVTITQVATITNPPHNKLRRDNDGISTPEFIYKFLESTSIPNSRWSSACACLTVPLATVTVTPTSTLSSTKVVGPTPVGDPVIALANPTAVNSWDAGAPADFDVDDAYYRIELGFSVSLYGFTSDLLFVSTNGLVWLDEEAQGDFLSYYTGSDAPSEPLPRTSNELPSVAILPFWSDLFINEGQPQGIFYEITGSAGSKTVTLEYLVNAYDSATPDAKYHFTVTLSENKPGKVTFYYYMVGDSSAGTVAVQNRAGNKAITYSRFGNGVIPGLRLEFNTNTGTVALV